MYSTLGSENNTTSYKRVLYGEITKNRMNCVYQLNIALYFNRRHSSIQSLWAKYVNTGSVEDLRRLPKKKSDDSPTGH